jgi:hypothetical protein
VNELGELADVTHPRQVGQERRAVVMHMAVALALFATAMVLGSLNSPAAGNSIVLTVLNSLGALILFVRPAHRSLQPYDRDASFPA